MCKPITFKAKLRDVIYIWADEDDSIKHSSSLGVMIENQGEFYARISGDVRGAIPPIDNQVFFWFENDEELLDAKVGDVITDSAAIIEIGDAYIVSQTV